jgi:cyclophilin family peptidyl-prolyl cis-trans isomerase
MQLLDDPDPEVRRLALTGVQGAMPGATALLSRGWEDPALTVRIEAARGWSRIRGWERGETPLEFPEALVALAVDDPADAVALAALDAVLAQAVALNAQGADARGSDPVGAQRAGEGATTIGSLLPRLEALARASGATPADAWHRPFRALTALARLDPDAAWAIVIGLEPTNPFARAQIARILGSLFEHSPSEARLRLDALARENTGDPLDGVVRDAALTVLASHVGREADPRLLEALASPDPGLVRTAARLLAGTPPAPETVEALADALRRWSGGVGGPGTPGAPGASMRATDRDARIALRERLEAQGADGARVLAELGAEPEYAALEALQGLPFPTLERLRSLEDRTVVLELEGGGVLEIRLFPFEAPSTAARLATLAESGALDGKTLHRSVPNFVVQGGSPFGNEYAGHGAYTRDELGRIGHWKGTVGVSTRGRDTGDGQLFVNTVDNLRLDHDYTVLGVLVRGIEHAEGLQEGARIVRGWLR